MQRKLVSEWSTARNCWIADTQVEEHDLVIIGGGVAGYVAAIKAGQEGMKVAWDCASIERVFRRS